MNEDHHEQFYAGDEFHWGKEPNEFVRSVLEFIPEGEPLRAIGIGAGEGRDTVFFAERGFDVLAVDTAANGLDKAIRLARERGVEIGVREGDVNSLELEDSFDLVYSAGTIQYLRPENREKQFAHFQKRTNPGGLHALLTFVDDPDIPPAPDWGENEFLYAPSELRKYYAGWRCLHFRAFVFDDDSGGEPHKHAVEEYVFEKP